ncbi:iron chelate uptake ABC transporter family permease subunit [Devosia sp. 2618]|uniref:iron chelate uptake ABC transporter family permease subunit n=1 Tax=Devosia sp. 2618 TaxID=3156454 RepID=UPI00339B124B
MAALGFVLLASIVIGVTVGAADISAREVWSTVGFRLGLLAESDVGDLRQTIVIDLRLPRLITAASVGAGLALCGTVLQALTRNPLADPYLLGLSSGASLGAVTLLTLGLGLLMPLGAFLGACAAITLTLAITSLLGGLSPVRAVLSGIAVSALASAFTSLLIFWSASGDAYREILSWLVGSLSGALWFDAWLTLTALVVFSLPMILSSRSLDALAFGDRSAAALGVNVGILRWVMFASTAMLTGLLVTVGGAIGFVGLVVPHVARLITGNQHRKLLPLSLLLGALLMVFTDTLARSLFTPRELPVGVITAIVGAPIFLLVLVKYRRLT